MNKEKELTQTNKLNENKHVILSGYTKKMHDIINSHQ